MDSEDNAPIVTVHTGQQYRGHVVCSTVQNRQIRSVEFLEIPYARAPIGDLRFRAPQSIPACHDDHEHEQDQCVYDATRRTKNPHQMGQPDSHPGESVWTLKQECSEDCLYVDVWTPALLPTRRQREPGEQGEPKAPGCNRPLPILVWLFGGGFVTGSTHLDVYNGALLSAKHSVIVFNISYRVGPLGFIYLPDAAASTTPSSSLSSLSCCNNGLLDQRLALNWIHQNAAQFGGDPNRICLAGNSAGAACVGYHLVWRREATKTILSICEPSRLIHRAIMQSGSPLAPWAMPTTQNAHYAHLTHHTRDTMHSRSRTFTALLREECQATTTGQSDLEFLRSLPASLLCDARWDSKLMPQRLLSFAWLPVWHDEMFHATPPPSLPHPLPPLLIGTVQNEASFFLYYEQPESVFTRNRADWPASSLCDVFQQTLSNALAASSDATRIAASHYAQVSHMDALCECLSDYHFVHPALSFVNRFYAGDQQAGHIFFYKFHTCSAHTTSSTTSPTTSSTSHHPVMADVWPDWVGTMHADECFCVFGWPKAVKPNNCRAREYCDRIMRLWAQFICSDDNYDEEQEDSGDGDNNQSKFSKRENWPSFSAVVDGPIMYLGGSSMPQAGQQIGQLHYLTKKEKARHAMWSKLFTATQTMQ